MVTKEEFINFVKAYETFENGIDQIEKVLSGNKPYKINLWDYDWADSVGKMWNNFMYSHFTEEGCDLINWWKYEDIDHIITQTVDSNLFYEKSKVEYNVNNIEDLWNYLIKFPSDYFKENLKECKANV